MNQKKIMSLVSKGFFGGLLILNLNSFIITPFLLTGSESGFKTESENYRAKIYHTTLQMYKLGVLGSYMISLTSKCYKSILLMMNGHGFFYYFTCNLIVFFFIFWHLIDIVNLYSKMYSLQLISLYCIIHRYIVNVGINKFQRHFFF